MPTLKYEAEISLHAGAIRSIASGDCATGCSTSIIAACKAWVADNPEMVRLRDVVDIDAVRLALGYGDVTACVVVKGVKYHRNGLTPERALTNLLDLMVPRD